MLSWRILEWYIFECIYLENEASSRILLFFILVLFRAMKSPWPHLYHEFLPNGSHVYIVGLNLYPCCTCWQNINHHRIRMPPTKDWTKFYKLLPISCFFFLLVTQRVLNENSIDTTSHILANEIPASNYAFNLIRGKH